MSRRIHRFYLIEKKRYVQGGPTVVQPDNLKFALYLVKAGQLHRSVQ